MESANTVELRDENIYPDESIIKEVLGKSYPVYLNLLDLYETNGMHPEWRYYKDGKAWLCKVQKKKKTIVWMSAWKGYMLATIYFPLRLLDEVLKLDISETQKKFILDTKNVGKSKPCTFEMKHEQVLPDFEKVMLYKLMAR